MPALGLFFGDDMNLTKNFKSEEFSCPCGCELDKEPMTVQFMLKLQKMRDSYGKPMHINSGYRCRKHNREIGGSVSSLHIQGKAADIRMRSAVDRFDLVSAALSAGMTGIGMGPNFLHVDNRETKPVIWLY